LVESHIDESYGILTARSNEARVEIESRIFVGESRKFALKPIF
jgi:hypothetical protein